MILGHSRLLPTRGIVRPPILIIRGGGSWSSESLLLEITTKMDPSSGITVGEGGRVRTRKYDDVEEVDVKADGEGLALPSYWIRRRRQLSGSLRPSLRLRPTIKDNLKKQKPISWGESGVK